MNLFVVLFLFFFFYKTQFMVANVTSTLRIMYPIRIVQYKPPELLGPNERGLQYIAIKNISKAPYGSKHQQLVQLNVAFPARFLCPQPKHASEAEIGEDYQLGRYKFQVMNGGSNVRVDILDLLPGQTVVVCLPLRSTKLTAKRLYVRSSFWLLLVVSRTRSNVFFFSLFCFFFSLLSSLFSLLSSLFSLLSSQKKNTRTGVAGDISHLSNTQSPFENNLKVHSRREDCSRV